VIKIVFFGLVKNNSEYLNKLNSLKSCVGEFFPENPPVITFIAQEPYKCNLMAEVVCISSSQKFKTTFGENYIILDNGICRELITGGLLPSDISSSYAKQADAVFAHIEKILIREDFPLNSIVRQWNYIENISSFEGRDQNYQEFNDSRSKFYAKTPWWHGYPAATGIGTHSGGIMVEFIALTGDDKDVINELVDNSLQVAAYKYSQRVLHGASDLYLMHMLLRNLNGPVRLD